jgi:hypothetical protein
VKDSGLGREGSRHGIEDYTNLKYMACATGGSSPADSYTQATRPLALPTI